MPGPAFDPNGAVRFDMKTGAASEAARAFMAYLKGPEAKAVIARYGYVDTVD